jgi:hypothetical protein
MKKSIIDAFFDVRSDQQSPDVVVANPQLNQSFVEACRRRGVDWEVERLNRTLINARKAGLLKGLKSKPVKVRNQDSYRFASEIAVRFLERRDHISLDTVLCNPTKAAEFDSLAAEIAPGYSVFEYRWAALGLRKKRKLRPELVSRVIDAILVQRHRVENLDIEAIPSQHGVYVFHNSKVTLYVGEAMSLYKRIKKHLDHSDNKGLARWLWEHGAGDLHLELHILPQVAATMVRKALEAEMIQSRKPMFNIAGSET